MSDFTVVQLLNQPTPVIITGGYVPRGAYAAGTDYAVGDSVDYNGSSYVMFVDAAAGTLPTDTTKWQVVANKGDTGGTGTLEDLGGATKALDNLASVAINTSLISDTDSTDDLGSTTKQWANVHTDRLVSTISDLVIENDLSDGDITFKVNDGGVDKTVMTLDGATGNVGIGTTGPTYKLDVNGTQRLTVDTGDVFVLNGTNTAGYSDIKFTGNGTDNFLYSFGSTYATSGRYIATSGLLDATGTGGLGLAASNASGVIRFYTNGNNERVRIDNTGNVGIGTTSPTNILSLGGNSARTFWLERHTTANTAGNTLTVTAGGATSGATDKAGGDLILTPGLSTGTGESGVQIKGVPAGSTGTTDGTQTLMIQVLGNKLSFYNQTPVVRPTALTPTGTYVLNTGDAGSDTEITLMRTRINELESKLQGLGLLT